MTRLIEFIESYRKIDDCDYQWNDNHGELIRCKECKWHKPKYPGERPTCLIYLGDWHDDDYCSRAEKETGHGTD